jgi:hypothetical protein
VAVPRGCPFLTRPWVALAGKIPLRDRLVTHDKASDIQVLRMAFLPIKGPTCGGREGGRAEWRCGDGVKLPSGAAVLPRVFQTAPRPFFIPTPHGV